jgi:hypothetical protein
VVLFLYAFENGFEKAYCDSGRRAGTYTRPDAENRTWTLSALKIKKTKKKLFGLF